MIEGRELLQMFNRVFERWGLPEVIKFDNGLPIVNPHQLDMPTLLVLWWVGLGIKPHRNTPACPQQNSTVEGLQGICERWVQPSKQPDIQTFQQELNEQTRIQREVYQVTRKERKTRLQLFPELENNPRRFDDKTFSWPKVKEYLAAQVWQRRVSRHAIRIFNTQIYVGVQFKGLDLTITYDPIEEKLMLRTHDGRLIKTHDKKIVTEQEILEYAGISMNVNKLMTLLDGTS